MTDTKVPEGKVPEGVLAAPASPVARRARTGLVANLTSALRTSRKAMAGSVLLVVFVVLAAVPGWIAPYDPTSEAFPAELGPTGAHWLGTTHYGQDILSQVIWGTRESLLIAIVVGGLASAVSVLVGVSAAYVGGIVDEVLSLLTDVFLVIPTFPLIIVIAAYAKSTSTWVLVAVLVVTGWSYGARQFRAQALSLRGRDFLEAARVRGERSLYVIVVEMLPTMTSLIVANFLGAALYAVLTAAGLQFIGLGDPNSQSWGTMLYWAESGSALQTGQYLWAVAPGLCIAALGAAFALVNYAFDEISNPALRPIRRPRAKRAHP